MADQFKLFMAHPSYWVKQDGRARNGWKLVGYYQEGDAPRLVAGGFQEPAEAADVAEELLHKYGIRGKSYVELRFNGDAEPHTVIFLMEDENDDVFGVWNTDSARWPIFYPPGNPYGEMLGGMPENFMPADEGEETHDDENSDGFGDTDEDSKLMDLSNDGSDDFEEDEDSDNLEEDEDAEDEFMEDDEAEDEITTDEEDEDEEDAAGDDGEEDEAEQEDDGEDEIEEDEGDEEDSSDDDSDDKEDSSDEDDGEAEEDEDELDDEQDETESDEEEEMKLPRLPLFAKMRGPLGWRKRADLEELSDRNVFALKVGVLDPNEELTPAKRERNVFAQVEFIEKDEDHATGTLRMKLPADVTLSDFTITKNGWITVEVPLPHEE